MLYKKISIFLCVLFLFNCVRENVVKQNLSKTVTKTPLTELIDTMDTIDGWLNYTDVGVIMNLNSVSGKTGGALEIDFDLTKGNWFALTKVINKDFSKFRILKFEYLGFGDTNSLEVKLEDEDGTNYGYLVPMKSNPRVWKMVKISLTEFKYWWGGDDKLNLKNIKNIHFAVSKRPGDDGGRGKIVIDNIELVK